MLDPRWCEPAPPEAIADALGGRRVERLVAARQVPRDVHRGRHPPRHAPAHDRQPAARAAGEDDPGRPHLRVRFELGRTRSVPRSAPVRRRAPLRHGRRAARKRRAVRVLRLPARGRAPQPRLHRGGATSAGARAQAARQGVPAEPGACRRGGQHLRRRGALPGPHPPAAPGGQARAARRSRRFATRSSRRSSSASTRRAHRSTTTATWTARVARSRTVSSCTRARASLPALRHADPQDAGGRPHLYLSALPAGPRRPRARALARLA